MADILSETDSGGRDGSTKLVLKPAIKEMIRTRVCPEHVTLLVDRVHVSSFGRDGRKRKTKQKKEAYRLWLTDGEKIIQATLKRDMHPFVTSGEVREGSYVVLTRYGLVQANKLDGSGAIWLLVVADMDAVASDGRRAGPYVFEDLGSQEATVAQQRDIAEDFRSTFQQDVDSGRDSESVDPARQHDRPQGKQTASGPPSPNKEKWEEEKEEEKEEAAAVPAPSPPLPPAPLLRPIARPLRITPLANLTGRLATRNRVHDVLVVITAVSAQLTERRRLPPSRDLLVSDASTARQVHMAVFVDARRFRPRVGTLALFRNVTTHEWRGGSLKVYPARCEGRAWYVPEPAGLEGCDVEALRRCWEERRTGSGDGDGDGDGNGNGLMLMDRPTDE